MTRTSATPATGGTPLLPPVAGLDVMTPSDREADALVHALVPGLARELGAGVADEGARHRTVDALVLATHVVRTGDGPHIAVCVELPRAGAVPQEPAAGPVAGPAADDQWRALVRAVEPAVMTLAGTAAVASWALVLGEHSVGPARLVEGARAAVAAHLSRSAGRAVHFPGVGRLTGDLTVSALLERSAVDRVVRLGAGSEQPDADPEAVVATRGFVRPRWVGGELVLHVQPGRGGVLVPFEVPHPTPCCADHD